MASANWAATAQWAAAAFGDGLLVDIGSTTTDLIALRGGPPGRRRAGLPGRGAHAAVRARPAVALPRRPHRRDERVVRHQRRRAPPARRPGPGARPAADRGRRRQGRGGHLPAPGAHGRLRRGRCRRGDLARPGPCAGPEGAWPCG
ncbi:hypothetical protein ABXN37_21605 [Piscinibacter sakaiensis]|uniref:hypothetical protein n=1 Tax=Piscinibacter sakaiensis TaxID=1547922 RepID=UPI003729031B